MSNQAHVDRLSNVLDSMYAPHGAEQIDLFRVQSQFMYAILAEIVTFDEGQLTVRNHAGTRDGQACYHDLRELA